MAQPHFIAGLDIGSRTVRLAVGQRVSDGREEEVQIIAAVESPAAGISRGVVNSIDDATGVVSATIEKVERILGAPLQSVWVGVSGIHVIAEPSRGAVAVAKTDGEINEDDVARAIEAARTVVPPLNYEILHVIPKSFCVDGQTGIKDPVGMTGIRLEVEAQIIQGVSSQVKNLTKCIYRAGLDIDDLVLGVLAAAEAVATKRQKELGVLVANVGGSTTSFAVFEEGDLMTTGVIPIGSDHITADLAIGLRTSIDVAEQVKLHYGQAVSADVAKKDEINLGDLGGEGDMVSRKYIAEIIEARVEEIFEKLDKELKKVGRSGMLPAGIIITGGGAKLPGMVELAKEKLRLPAQFGAPVGIIAANDKTQDPSFSTAIGLTLWGAAMEKGKKSGSGMSTLFSRDTLGTMGGRVGKWLKSLMP